MPQRNFFRKYIDDKCSNDVIMRGRERFFPIFHQLHIGKNFSLHLLPWYYYSVHCQKLKTQHNWIRFDNHTYNIHIHAIKFTTRIFFALIATCYFVLSVLLFAFSVALPMIFSVCRTLSLCTLSTNFACLCVVFFISGTHCFSLLLVWFGLVWWVVGVVVLPHFERMDVVPLSCLLCLHSITYFIHTQTHPRYCKIHGTCVRDVWYGIQSTECVCDRERNKWKPYLYAFYRHHTV